MKRVVSVVMALVVMLALSAAVAMADAYTSVIDAAAATANTDLIDVFTTALPYAVGLFIILFGFGFVTRLFRKGRTG